MKKYLITGFSGFVSRHFLEYLEGNKIAAKIVGLDLYDHDLKNKIFEHIEYEFENVQLLDINKIERIIDKFQPDYILHLASYSSVGASWKHPIQSFQNNTNIFLNMLEAVRKLCCPVRILSIGSSEEYGNVNAEDLPITEMQPLQPNSPYAVARVAQEHLSTIYVEGFDLDIVMTRSFNHIGPFQKDNFVIPSLVRQLLRINKGGNKGNIVAGDLSIVRDFTDVRDVVSAYYWLLKDGKKGEVYNVCSGEGHSLHELVNKLCRLLDIEVSVISDPKLIRPSELKTIIGSNKKISHKLGWKREYDIKHSLSDIVKYWQSIKGL